MFNNAFAKSLREKNNYQWMVRTAGKLVQCIVWQIIAKINFSCICFAQKIKKIFYSTITIQLAIIRKKALNFSEILAYDNLALVDK